MKLSDQRINEHAAFQGYAPLSPHPTKATTTTRLAVPTQQVTNEQFSGLPQRLQARVGTRADGKLTADKMDGRPAVLAASADLSVGRYGPHRGVFIGEVHDQRETMEAFNNALPALAGKVDVIFLEYYPKGESPYGKSVEDIEKDLESFNKTFGKGPQIAQEVHQMCTLASKHGIDIRGIEVPTPKGSERGPKYLIWRLSAACNQAFLDNANHFANEKGRESISFCMYGGLVHWAKFKTLAPEVCGYRVSQGRLAPI